MFFSCLCDFFQLEKAGGGGQIAQNIGLTPKMLLYDRSGSKLLAQIPVPVVNLKIDPSNLEVNIALLETIPDENAVFHSFEIEYHVDSDGDQDDQGDDDTISQYSGESTSSSTNLNNSKLMSSSDGEPEATSSQANVSDEARTMTIAAYKAHKDNFDKANNFARMTLYNPELPYHATETHKKLSNLEMDLYWPISQEKLREIHQKNNGLMYLNSTKPKNVKGKGRGKKNEVKVLPTLRYQVNPSFGVEERKRIDGIARKRPAKYVCNVIGCKEEFETFFLWRKHLQDDHDHGKVQNELPGCVYCANTFPKNMKKPKERKDCLKRHLPFVSMITKAKAEVVYFCPLCIQNEIVIGFTSNLLYRDHLAADHKDSFPRIYVCGVCSTPQIKDSARGLCQRSCYENNVPFTCVLHAKEKTFADAIGKINHYLVDHKREMHQCNLTKLDSKSKSNTKNPNEPEMKMKKLKKFPFTTWCPINKHGCSHEEDPKEGQSSWAAMWDHILTSHDEGQRALFVKKYVPESEKHKFNIYEQR